MYICLGKLLINQAIIRHKALEINFINLISIREEITKQSLWYNRLGAWAPIIGHVIYVNSEITSPIAR